MINKNETSLLIRALHTLYSKISKLELGERVRRYHPKAGNMVAPDISAPLAKHIEKLVAANPHTSHSNMPSAAKHPVTDTPHVAHQTTITPGLDKGVQDSADTSYSISSRKQTADQYMGEKLKASTWTHLHAALMQARNGNVSSAKMHADIANQALKEAAHYMDEAEYKVHLAEVEKALAELEAIKK